MIQIIQNRSRFLRTKFVLKMKMREKPKYKTLEEIPLEEIESQIREEGQFIIDCSHFE